MSSDEYRSQQKIRNNETEVQSLKVRIKNLEGRVFRLEEKIRKQFGVIP